MRTTVVTGAAGGMGQAIRKFLEGNGEKVIGVDVRDAEVIADLSTEDGRGAMVEEIGQLCGGKLDGVVAGAGVANREDIPGDLVTSVNYFGGVATLDGLRPMLAKGDAPRAVGIGSNSMSVVPIIEKLLDLYQAGDEAAARELSNQFDRTEPAVYGTSKFGFARWIREHAIKPEWIGSGIALNAIAPGVIATPMNTEEGLKAVLELGEAYPVPAGRPGTADEIAGLVGFLLSERAGFCCGTVVFIDGGTEPALRRGDSPSPRAWV